MPHRPTASWSAIISSDRRRMLTARSGLSSSASQTLAKVCASILPPPKLAQPSGRKVQVPLGGPLRLLLEGVQHVDRIGQGGRVDDAEGAGRVPQPDLPYAR